MPTVAAGPTTRVQINNLPSLYGHLNVTQTNEVFRTNLPAPDPAWTFTDLNGHFHAFDRGKELPTLTATRRRVPCDGSCGGVCEGEGYTVVDYTCVLCGEPVEPGSIPGPHSVSLPGPTEWEATCHGQVDTLFGMVGQKVSVRATTTSRDGSVWTGFGIATVTAVTTDGDEGEATLLGSGDLGEIATAATR